MKKWLNTTENFYQIFCGGYSVEIQGIMILGKSYENGQTCIHYFQNSQLSRFLIYVAVVCLVWQLSARYKSLDGIHESWVQTCSPLQSEGTQEWSALVNVAFEASSMTV